MSLARPAPLTTFTVSYGGVSLLNDPAALTPVFIGPTGHDGLLYTSTVITSSGGQVTSSEVVTSGGTYELLAGSAVTSEMLGISGSQLDPATDITSGAWVNSNPLGMAWYAAQQTGTTDFYIMVTPDTSGTSAADKMEAGIVSGMSKAAKTERCYSIVPMIQSGGIVTAAENIVNFYNNPKRAQMKKLWVFAPTPTSAIVSSGASAVKDFVVSGQKNSDEHINYVYTQGGTVAGIPVSGAQFVVPVLATMRATMAPHAPLTDVPISGVVISDDIQFSEDDYEDMNNAGVWVCYKDERGESVTRHAVTTKVDGTIAMEDSAVSNADNIVRTVRNQVSWLRGNCNVTPALIDKIYANVQAAFSHILSRNYSDLIGPQILEVKSVKVEQDPNDTSAVVGTFDLDLPDVYLKGDFTFNLF